MQYGILKYDEWDDLLWLYNSIDSPIRTSLTGSLIALSREDESIRYTHFLSEDRDPYRIAEGCNAYCGCFDNSIYALGAYPEYLLACKGSDLFVVTKDGERVLNVLSQTAQYELTDGGKRHICCALFPCAPKNTRIPLSTSSSDLYFVDAPTGQVASKFSAMLDSARLNYGNDKISVISDFMSNQCTSSCLQSYQLEYAGYQTADYSTMYTATELSPGEPAPTQPAPTKQDSSTDWGKPAFSFQSVAEKYGSVESIPEFVPSGYSSALSTHNFESNPGLHSFGTNTLTSYRSAHSTSNLTSHPTMISRSNSYMERTIGSMSLECILNEMKASSMLQNEFVDTTCVGMTSGFLHLVDNRSNKLISSINSNNSPVYSISASGNTIATTTCTIYYSNSFSYQYNAYSYPTCSATRLFEPVVYLHDIRMMKTSSLMLPKPVSSLFIVPKSDRLFALSQDGDLFDCTISSLEFKKHQKEVSSSVYYALEVSAHPGGETVEVFTSDISYSVSKSTLPNQLSYFLDYSSSKLPRKLQELPKSESRKYNTTPFASLVGTFDGDVAHIFVQIFFFLPKLPSIQYHVCESSHCITCQIGFGLHNLQVHYENSLFSSKSNRPGKDSTVKKFSNNTMYVTQLQQLMLVESEPNLRTPLTLLLWLIEKINAEMQNYYSANNLKVTTSLIKDLFSHTRRTTTTCTRNGHVNTKVTNNNYHVHYEHLGQSAPGDSSPSSGSVSGYGETSPSASIPFAEECARHEKLAMEYCQSCNSSVECTVTVEFTSTPNVLVVDLANTKLERLHRDITFNGMKYNLYSFYFTLPPDNVYYRSLAYVRLPKKYQADEREWILVNDGIVMYVDESEEDIFNFSKHWKIPIFAIYVIDPRMVRAFNSKQAKGRRESTPVSGPKDIYTIEEIVPSFDEKENIVSVKGRLVPLPYPSKRVPVPSYVFMSEHNIAHNPLAHNKIKTFTPLTLEELNVIQNSAFLVSLDIEYVKSDLKNTSSFHVPTIAQGQATTSRTSFIVSEEDEKYLYTVARVSAIRGNDHLYGVPFLDHYILNNKPPKDYMTRFSGIHSGDLELKSSLHWLTTEKLIHLKLRYLVDNGCKIVGHGLEQDLRILNLCVPSENIIDTVELFWIPGKRYLSLQFLAFYLLNQKIQQNEHDSIEDAKTALQLYKLYINFKLNNKLNDVIEKLYEIGYKTNWTLPFT